MSIIRVWGVWEDDGGNEGGGGFEDDGVNGWVEDVKVQAQGLGGGPRYGSLGLGPPPGPRVWAPDLGPEVFRSWVPGFNGPGSKIKLGPNIRFLLFDVHF